MKNRERFKKIMEFKKPDRIPCIEFASYWDETIKRWVSEGLNPDRTDDTTLRKDFGLDDYRQFWVEPYSRNCSKPAQHGAPIVLNKNEYSAVRKELYPPDAFDLHKLSEAADSQADGDTVIWITLEGFFWFPRYLLGIERHLYAFYDVPELVHQINDELADYHCRVLDDMQQTCSADFMSFAEDLSYNQGPMISRELFEEFLLPYYARVLPRLDSAGTLSFVDSDGRIEEIIPWYKEAGFKGCLPVEANAGNDLERIRENFPDWLMIGGIEKRALYADASSLRNEVRNKFELALGGGYLPSVDHQTPPEVSLAQYKRYLKELKRFSRMKL